MAYFRVLTAQLANIQNQLNKDDSWLILINADPDALGSAMALQRLIRKKVKSVHLARINDISRPDNLAMIRNLRISIKAWEPQMKDLYDKFAILDSQPHHSPLFSGIDFSIIIDHHPLPSVKDDCKSGSGCTNARVFSKSSLTHSKYLTAQEEICYTPIMSQNLEPKNTEQEKKKGKESKINTKTQAAQELLEAHKMQDIRPDYGATCTMMTEYLYHANIRPGKYLATALQYGIRTDTGTFGRQSTEVDLRAYHYLSRFADQNLLMRIIRSEYLPQWLPYFTLAFENFRPCGMGHFTYLSNVESSDILVVVADFFLKVHGLKYIVVAGVDCKKVICIFRGSNVNLGLLAQKAFAEYGSAGGHKVMARAEIPLAKLRGKNKALSFNLRKKTLTEEENKQLETFLLSRLKQFGTKKTLKD